MTSESLLLRLPYDAIYLILVYGLSQDTFFPLTFSHVCGRWRADAIRTPVLWTNLTFNNESNKLPEQQAEWIARSKQALLNISIRTGKLFGNQSKAASLEKMGRDMNLIRPHVHRWKTLYIANWRPAPKLLRIISDQLRYTTAPNLESIVVINSLMYTRTSIGRTKYAQFKLGTPSLRNITLTDLPVRLSNTLLTGLRKWSISEDNFDADATKAVAQLRDLLVRSPDLVEFVVHRPLRSFDRRPWSGPPPLLSPQRITANELQSITLPTSWITDFLSSVHMPNLRTVPDTFFSPDHIPLICDLKALPNLIALAFGKVHGHSPRVSSQLPEMLAVLPRLTELDLTGVALGDNDRWVEALIHLCPELVRLHIDEGEGITIERIKAIVSGRQGPSSRVSALKDITCRALEGRCWREWVHWREKNMALR